MTSAPTTADDAYAVVDVLLTERAARDLAQRDDMRDTYMPDSLVRVSWFRGTGAEFTAASWTMYDAGSRSFHEIGAPRVQIRSGKALAQADGAVHSCGSLAGIEVDLTSYGRLYWKAQRTGAGWRIAGLTMLHVKDTLAPADPTQEIPQMVVAAAADYRSSYRYLALMLQTAGHQIDQELPGTDRPKLVEKLLTENRAWLDTKD